MYRGNIICTTRGSGVLVMKSSKLHIWQVEGLHLQESVPVMTHTITVCSPLCVTTRHSMRTMAKYKERPTVRQ
jgi:hypothetical protein